MSLNRKQYKYNEIEIINLYNKGLNSVQIAEYYNYPKHTYKTISKILKKNMLKNFIIIFIKMQLFTCIVKETCLKNLCKNKGISRGLVSQVFVTHRS